ncbi:MAG: flagellar basal body-associated FliL family protein [Ignavibacteria bacterium]|nr:flagellar basal body-associated FliL family protein [Ignavibacteria bacterium]
MEKVDKPAAPPVDIPASVTEKKGFNVKILLFGLPLFIVQLVAVYFITANFLLNKMHANGTDSVATAAGKKDVTKVVKEEKPSEFGKFIYEIQDQIVNPAGTDGRRLLMVSLGFDVPTEENKKEMEVKDVLLKDAALSVMSSKDLSQLGNMAYRDTLRTEIVQKLRKIMPEVKINTIYFSKYILQ